MSTNVSATSHSRGAIVSVVAAGAMMLAVAFGIRSVFGVFMQPISGELFGGQIEVFALSLAIQNLVWGLAQPGFGAIADKFGDRPALWLGLACYAVGMIATMFASSALMMHLSVGLLIGAGISGTAFGLVLSVVGRASSEEKRSQNLGLVSALGSGGQVLIPLFAGELVKEFDWRESLFYVSLLLIPLILCVPFMRAKASAAAGSTRKWAMDDMPLHCAVSAAFKNTNYVLLTVGFFVCGFHIAFITAHLPNFVENFCTGTDAVWTTLTGDDKPMTKEELRGFGLQALGVVGLANIIGTFSAGHLGSIFPKPYVLSAIYALRALIIIVFIALPISPISVLIFAFTMGLLWLSTVPLTSGLVFSFFGPRYASTLYGFVFLSHQVGSFLGVWLGGVFFDAFQSYDLIWYASIGLGVFSAIVHLPVRERPYEPAAA
ncbi:MAG: MFS transporter [Neomegalonema sp.]|nr:MFS transporter [Neomegalonema sp.]